MYVAQAFVSLHDLTDLKAEHFRQSRIDHDGSRQQSLDRQDGLDSVVYQRRLKPPLGQSAGRRLALLDFGICDQNHPLPIDRRGRSNG